MRHTPLLHWASHGTGWARRARIGGVAAGLLAATSLAGCGRHEPTRSAPPAPPADFLLAAGDSTFWVTSGPTGVRVRGSPLILARYGDRFYEVYVADEDHSFYDAVFTTQRIYRRDLLSGDSTVVFVDTAVAAAARGYGAAHPSQTPLAADEDAADDPSTSVSGEVDIVDVDGPFLSYEYRASVDTKAGGPADAGDMAGRQTLRRGVVDLRSGIHATLRGIFGLRLGDTAAVRGRRAFVAALDSVRAARANGDERAQLAFSALRDFVFDPSSFTATNVDRDPGVQFFAAAHGARRGGLTLPLPPVRIPEAASQSWWVAEQLALPAGGPDSASDVWARPGLDVVARYDTAGNPELGQGVLLILRQGRDGASGGRRGAGPPAGPRRDSGAREWRVGRFPAPTRRLYWLDRPSIDSTARRALVRAFDESALYGDDARSARAPRPVGRRRIPRVAFAALPHFRRGVAPHQAHGAHGGHGGDGVQHPRGHGGFRPRRPR
jgi:hypothetical protein